MPMKGHHVNRSLSQNLSGPCHCMSESCHVTQGHNNQPHCLPPRMQGSSGGTFPRSHPSQQPYDSCQESLPSSRRMQCAPSGQLYQFDKRVPFHPDGFRTLQYQRSSSGGQRSESPSRIRHLVHSVQRLFNKSHSLEDPANQLEYNSTGSEHWDSGVGGHRGRVSKDEQEGCGCHLSSQDVLQSGRRSRSHERSKSRDSRHRDRNVTGWTSDDNLDSDGNCLVASRRQHRVPPGHQTLNRATQDLTLRNRRSQGPVGECLACNTMTLGKESRRCQSRGTWTSMTVNQAREVYSQPGTVNHKALKPQESRVNERSYLQLQVPSEQWGQGHNNGGLGSKEEIPFRRMRSGSYVKAMGEDDVADMGPKTQPRSADTGQREALHRSISMDQHFSSSKYSCKHANASTNSHSVASNHAGDCHYTHSLTNAQGCVLVGGDSLNRRFEAVRDSGLGESQAVQALDLPGCFRSRSHSYVRAIQAGVSQDDDCLPVFSLSDTQGEAKGKAVFPCNKKMPPPLPPRKSRPSIRVIEQSSTESTQDSCFHSQWQPAPGCHRQHSMEGDAGRVSRSGYYATQRSNSFELLDGDRWEQGAFCTGGLPVRAIQSSSSDTLLEGGSSQRKPLPHSCMSQGREAHRLGWRPSIAVQVNNSETLTESDVEQNTIREVQSVGIQVEEDKRCARFKCSNSLTAGVQTDLDGGLLGRAVTMSLGCSIQEGEQHTVHMHAHRASCCPHYQPGVGPRDGEFFLRLLHIEVEKMEGWCQDMERETEENQLPEEVLARIRRAVNSAQLLMSHEVQNFFRLCQKSLDPTVYPQPSTQELASQWELLHLALEEVRLNFLDLQRLRESDWRLPLYQDDNAPPPLPKKPNGSISRARAGAVPLRQGLSMDRAECHSARETHWVSSEAKQASSLRQNSATESADSIELYIPEGQTRF